MKKEKKFTLEKFEVAKLKNMKKISGGEGVPRPTDDLDVTDLIRKISTKVC